MSLKRFILASLLSLCLGFSLVSSVFAYSVGSNSNARSDSYVSSLPFFIAGQNNLLAANGTISPVTNTVNRTLISAVCRSGAGSSTDIPGSTKYLSESGSYSFISSTSNIKRVIFTIPYAAMPHSGSYLFSYSFNSDVAIDNFDVRVVFGQAASNAANGSQTNQALYPDVKNNAGEFKLNPVLIDFRQATWMLITVDLATPSDVYGGTLSIRYEISTQTGGVQSGFTQPVEDSSSQTAQNTQQIADNTSAIANAQNETNSKLDQIVQHISDQLFALWNQIAGYLITPWMKQDRDLHDETIEKLDEMDTSVTNTIEDQSEWHANFIIEGLKHLFIPSGEYFQNKITEMRSFFETRLGFLGYTLTYFIRLLNGIMNASQNSIIRFPGIHAPNRATGEDYILLPAQDVDLGAQISQISEGSFNLLEFCRTAGDIVLVLSFLVLLQDKLREVEK